MSTIQLSSHLGQTGTDSNWRQSHLLGSYVTIESQSVILNKRCNYKNKTFNSMKCLTIRVEMKRRQSEKSQFVLSFMFFVYWLPASTFPAFCVCVSIDACFMSCYGSFHPRLKKHLSLWGGAEQNTTLRAFSSGLQWWMFTFSKQTNSGGCANDRPLHKNRSLGRFCKCAAKPTNRVEFLENILCVVVDV